MDNLIKSSNMQLLDIILLSTIYGNGYHMASHFRPHDTPFEDGW